MYLEELINTLPLENNLVEYKALLNKDDILSWLKTIAGMANAEGGDFFIGVEDKTGKLIGFDRVDADNERNFLNNAVNEHLIPRPILSVSFVRYEIRQKERFILQVHIQESTIKPVILKYKGVPAIYMRRDGFTNGATYEEIISMSIRSNHSQYDTLPSDIKYTTSSFQDLQKFYAAHTGGKMLSDKALASMGFFDKNRNLANGAVLFEDSYTGSKTEVMCSVFSGINKGSERIISVNRFNGNITSALQFMMDFVSQRMNHSIEKTDDGRKNVDAFPARALFEGLVNAVAHRDYYLDGTQIQVDMFKDRLEITSPGGFYHGENIKRTYDLSGIISKRRNELISAVLVACNVMEAAGTGFDKIIEDYAGADDSHRPFICSASDHFTLVLPDLTYTNGICDSSLPNVNFIPAKNGTDLDAKVLSFCYSRARKVSEIAERLHVSDSTYLRKKILENLENQNYLEKSRTGRASYYKTNHDAVTMS